MYRIEIASPTSISWTGSFIALRVDYRSEGRGRDIFILEVEKWLDLGRFECLFILEVEKCLDLGRFECLPTLVCLPESNGPVKTLLTGKGLSTQRKIRKSVSLKVKV